MIKKLNENSLSNLFKKQLLAKNILLSNRRGLKFWPIKPQNGRKTKKLFGQVYKDYCLIHLPTLSESTQDVKRRRCDKFILPIENILMQDFTSEMVSEFILFTKENYLKGKSRQRKNHDKSLKELRVIFNFYIDHYDSIFRNPIRRVHFKMGVLEAIAPKNRQISKEEMMLFHQNINPKMRNFSLLQIMAAARVGEISGLQWKNIDFSKRILNIKEVLVWIRTACINDGVTSTSSSSMNRHYNFVCEERFVIFVFKNIYFNSIIAVSIVAHI